MYFGTLFLKQCYLTQCENGDLRTQKGTASSYEGVLTEQLTGTWPKNMRVNCRCFFFSSFQKGGDTSQGENIQGSEDLHRKREQNWSSGPDYMIVMPTE